MKKMVYGFVVLFSVSIGIWLVYYRIAPHITVYEPTSAQIIVPDTIKHIESNQKSSLDTVIEKSKSESAHTNMLHKKKITEYPSHELHTETSDAFKSFLTGLWYQPSSKKNEKKSIFFNSDENSIVFSINNIEEIFTITSTAKKREGILFSAHNTSISSIKRRIDIELTGVDEIRIRVIDDVARLKIGTASNWDGVYRKMSNITQSETDTARKITEIKNIISKNGVVWKTADDHILSFSDFCYTFEHNSHYEKGWYVLFTIKDMILMQWKNDTKKDTFFVITLDTAQEQKQRLNLTEVFVTLNENIRATNYQLVFEIVK